MTTSRLAYRIDAANPGSDLAAETAAAMASASMVFHQSDPAYSNELLEHAKQVILAELFFLSETYHTIYIKPATGNLDFLLVFFFQSWFPSHIRTCLAN